VTGAGPSSATSPSCIATTRPGRRLSPYAPTVGR
jgi:hypothetical protein